MKRWPKFLPWGSVDSLLELSSSKFLGKSAKLNLAFFPAAPSFPEFLIISFLPSVLCNKAVIEPICCRCSAKHLFGPAKLGTVEAPPAMAFRCCSLAIQACWSATANAAGLWWFGVCWATTKGHIVGAKKGGNRAAFVAAVVAGHMFMGKGELTNIPPVLKLSTKPKMRLLKNM